MRKFRQDSYCYPDSEVLINKLGIRSDKELEKAESAITFIRLAQIKSVTGDFDYDHLKRMHGFIFGDIYEWAGHERRSDICKNEQVLGGLSVKYTYPTEIAREARRAIAAFHETDWVSLPTNERAEKYAAAVAALWQVHPFREGNTRTIMTFACEFSDECGFHMDRQLFGKHADFTRRALVMASIGQYSEPKHIIRIFADSMERGERAVSMSAGSTENGK